MLLIVLGHIIMAHHDIDKTEGLISQFLRPFSIVAVNVFVLISGYFGIHFKAERLIKLCTQTWFYSVAAFVVAVVIGAHVVDVKRDFLVFLPVFSKQYWFVTVYAALYCLAPVLNKVVDAISLTTYRQGLFIGFILFYILPTLSYLLNSNQLVDDAGYGIVNFVYLYFLGRYIRLHYADIQSPSFYLYVYLGASTLLFVCQYVLSSLLGFAFSSWISYNTFFVFVAAIGLFMYIKNIKIHSSVINVLAAPCLAVYLFHLAPYGWNLLVDFLCIREARGWMYVAMLAVYPAGIYLAGFCVEKIRLLLFSSLENKICSIIAKCVAVIKQKYKQ